MRRKSRQRHFLDKTSTSAIDKCSGHLLIKCPRCQSVNKTANQHLGSRPSQALVKTPQTSQTAKRSDNLEGINVSICTNIDS